MSDTAKITCKEWREYYKRVWGNAWKETKLWAFGRGLCVGVIAFFIQYFAKFRDEHDTFLMILIAVAAAIIVFAVEFFVHLITAPARMDMETQRKFDAAANAFNDAHDHIEKAHIGTVTALKTAIQDLNAKLAEKSEADRLIAKREMAKELLGYKLIILENRLHEAREITRISFNGDIKTKAWQATGEIFNATETVISEHLGIAEAALFRVVNIAAVGSVNGYGAESIMDWQWHINSITAKLDALQDIIKKLI